MLLLSSILLILSASAFLCEGATNNTKERIVNGYPIDISQASYQVSIEQWSIYGWYHSCGGSIISPNWILTAAHCLYQCTKDIYGQIAYCVLVQPQSLQVRAGSTYKLTNQPLSQLKSVYASNPHYMYEPKYGKDYDIGFLYLWQTLDMTSAVRTIPLATTAPPVGHYLFVTGWGAYTFQGPSVYALQGIYTNTIDFNVCRQTYGTTLTNRMMCTGPGPCQGDSGGPAVYYDVYGQRYLVGVVSFAIDCGKNPNVYANVVNLRSEIRLYTGL